jgi:hypothetical protein
MRSSAAAADVYRDEPLDDEAELRELVGEDAVDAVLMASGPEGVASAIDAMRLLQGWVADGSARAWLLGPQQRLGGRTPLGALAAGAREDVDEVLRVWLAAQS